MFLKLKSFLDATRHTSVLFLTGVFLVVGILTIVISFLGCATTSPAVSAIAVSPGTASVVVGGTQSFTASGRTSSGSLISIDPTWSTAGGVGTISATGVFTGSILGSGFVYASQDEVTGSATVTVTDKGAIAGTVSDSDQAAISGIAVALVSDSSKSDTSSATGTYTISNLDAGTYEVQASGNLLYLTGTEESVVVDEAETTTVNFTMLPRVSISSQSISQATTRVTITGTAKNWGGSTVTAVDVTYRFYGEVLGTETLIGSGSAAVGDLGPLESQNFTVIITLSQVSYTRYTSSVAGESY